MSSTTLSNFSQFLFAPAKSGVPSLAARMLGWVGEQWTSLSATKLSRTLTPYEEAEQLRAMALNYQSSDPGFAQDLYAAADRHEYEHGAAY